MKRTFIQFICIILIFTLGTTVTQAGQSSNEVFIVDSTGGGNFTSIQEAIDNAQDEDIILVNPGVYYENVTVNKELTILSLANDTSRTLVIGSTSDSDVIDIYSNNVTIEGFYIIGGSSGVERDVVGINLEGVENCSVNNNALVLNDAGISLNNSNNNYLDNNLVSLSQKGIMLAYSDENVLSNNTVMSTVDGFSLNNSTNNTFVDNTADANINGIFLGDSHENIFSNNTIRRNLYGVDGEAAISNFIINNSLYLNNIGIKLNESSKNSIYENKFHNFLDAMDDGNNTWNSSSRGNSWHNYTGQDAEGNGIGDTPYVINRTTGSIDYMPVFSISNTENMTGKTSENMTGNVSENTGGENNLENMSNENSSENKAMKFL